LFAEYGKSQLENVLLKKTENLELRNEQIITPRAFDRAAWQDLQHERQRTMSPSGRCQKQLLLVASSQVPNQIL